MTVSAVTKRVDYAGDGVVLAFAVTFKYHAASEIVVTLIASTGVPTVQTLTTHYTLTDPGDSGTVTMVTEPASGETLVIERVLTYLQSTDYVENDAFPAAAHEDAIDRLTMIIHQLTGAAEITNHIKAGHTQIFDGSGGAPASFVVTSSVTESTWESVGPTSGFGDNDWAPLDDLPDDANILLVDCLITWSEVSKAFDLHVASGDVASPAQSTARTIVASDKLGVAADKLIRRLMIPLGKMNTFKTYWVSTDSSPSISFIYRGFISG